MDYQKLLEIARKVSQLNDKKRYYGLKNDLVKLLKGDDQLIFAKDVDARIRVIVASSASEEKAKAFFDDRALSVFKAAARHVDIDFLFKFSEDTKSTRKRKAANEVIIERISQQKVRNFVLNQPRDVIKSLMD
jgi:hypothetical protein